MLASDGFFFSVKERIEIFYTSQEIHRLLKQGVAPDNISSQLSPWAYALFEFLPPFIKKQVWISLKDLQ